MKLDKKAFTIQSFEEAADHQKHRLFLHLMLAAYGFVDTDWPKMDRDYFEVKSLIKDGSTS